MKRLGLICFLLLIHKELDAVIVRHDKKLAVYTGYANDARFNCVGYFNKKWRKESGGTCVLLSPRYILTAAHCFSIRDGVDSIGTYEFHINGKVIKGKRLIVHPGYSNNDNTKLDFDLAIVALETPVDTVGILPVLYTQDAEKGKTGIFVAYGASGAGNSLETKTIHLKLGGHNIIDSVGGSLHKGRYCKLYADFDDPEGIAVNKMGDKLPLEMEFGTCGGDSGGPLFIENENGTLYLAGILSGGGVSEENITNYSFYGQVSNWTRISAHRDWIEGVLGE